MFRRRPLVLRAYLNRDGSHHTLCPVAALRNFINVTDKFKSRFLFVNPLTGARCNKGHISYHFKRLVSLAQPGVYARFQDLRKMASWKAFFNNMSIPSIRNRGFWKCNNALAKRYLSGAVPLSRPCVALGQVCHS